MLLSIEVLRSSTRNSSAISGEALRGKVRLGNLLHGMKPGAVLLLRLFYGTNLSAKGSELAKFLLDCLQTFMPLAVSDLSIGLIPAFLPILLVQPLNFRNLQTETPDLCS